MSHSFQRAPKLRDPSKVRSLDEPGQSDGTRTSFGALDQLDYLETAVRDWREQRTAKPSEPATKRENPSPSDTPKTDAGIVHPALEVKSSTIVKSCIAIVLAVGLGWLPVQRLLATTSAEAVVNARVITLRAPIEGEVSLAKAGTEIGSTFTTAQDILTIRNPRTDFTHLTNLRRSRAQLQTSIAALESKHTLLTTNLDELSAQQERFRVGRVEQIEQRVAETDAEIASAKARYTTVAAALTRASSLRRTDAVSQAFLDKAVQEESVAKDTVRGLIERRKGMLVELRAAKAGTYIGDSYNDTPQSAQRKMEIGLELADVRARVTGSRAELSALDMDIAEEARRKQALSEAVVQSPANGRVWEILTAPGEHVNAGQDLVRMLDCSSAFVTASVSETVYQRLTIGQSATFRPRGGGQDLQGLVVGLNGLSAVASNSAIRQSALSREPYHVTLKFPELQHDKDCFIGRSGLVQFGSGSLAAAAAK